MEQLAGPSGEHSVSLIISLLSLGLELETEADDPIRDTKGKRFLVDTLEVKSRKYLRNGDSRHPFTMYSVKSAVKEMYSVMLDVVKERKVSSVFSYSLLVGSSV